MQYAARLAALSSESADILAALDQLDADSIEHAEFLAVYHDQASDNHICLLLQILVVCRVASTSAYWRHVLIVLGAVVLDTRSAWSLT